MSERYFAIEQLLFGEFRLAEDKALKAIPTITPKPSKRLQKAWIKAVQATTELHAAFKEQGIQTWDFPRNNDERKAPSLPAHRDPAKLTAHRAKFEQIEKDLRWKLALLKAGLKKAEAEDFLKWMEEFRQSLTS